MSEAHFHCGHSASFGHELRTISLIMVAEFARKYHIHFYYQ